MSNNAQVEAVPARGESAGGGRPSAQVIEAWLIGAVAELLGIDAAEIDPEQELTAYGLSSVTGVMLTGDVEEWLGVTLEPTVAWEYPTVRELARHLADETEEGVGA